MRIFSLLIICLFSVSAYAQWPLPARQVNVSTNGWTRLAPTATTAQAVFNYIDAQGIGGGSGGYGTNTYVNPSTWQYLLETPTTPTGGVVSGFYLPGTNIVGATYSDTNKTWTITPTDLSGVLPGTNIAGFTYSSNQWFYPDSFLGISSNYFFVYSIGSANYQVVTAGVNTLVTFVSEEYDPNNWFETNTFTVPYTGLYLLNCRVRVGLTATPTAARSMLYFYVNGSLENTFLDREGDNLVSDELNHFSVVRRFTNNTPIQLYRVLDGAILTTNEYREFSAVLLSKD